MTVTEQAWDDDTPIGKVRMVNLIATIPGARPDRIIISGHYDTKLFRDSRFVGANDGGSSAAFLLELARVLKARRNALTIELLFLDGEEAFCLNWDDCARPGAPDNTYGSRHYVVAAKRGGTLAGIKANILVDMIADRDLRLKRDLNSTPWLTDIVWAAARTRKLDTYFVPRTTQIEDDHIPFMQAGVPSVDIIDLEYDAWHTPGDTLDAVSARSLQIVGDVLLAALPQIEVLTDCDGGQSDAAGARMNEDALAALNVRQLAQRIVRGKVSDRRGRRFLEADRRGLGHDAGGLGDGLRGEAERRDAHDFVAYRKLLDARTDGCDPP